MAGEVLVFSPYSGLLTFSSQIGIFITTLQIHRISLDRPWDPPQSSLRLGASLALRASASVPERTESRAESRTRLEPNTILILLAQLATSQKCFSTITDFVPNLLLRHASKMESQLQTSEASSKSGGSKNRCARSAILVSLAAPKLSPSSMGNSGRFFTKGLKQLL